MDYDETTKALWRFIGDEVIISILIYDPEVPTAGADATFLARLEEPPEWAGTGWRPGGTTPEGKKPVSGAGHLVAGLSPSRFVDGRVIADGEGVEATFRGGLRVTVRKPDRSPGRVIDSSALSP